MSKRTLSPRFFIMFFLAIFLSFSTTTNVSAADYAISRNGTIEEYENVEELLNDVKVLLKFTEEFVVIVARTAFSTMRRVAEEARKQGIDLIIDPGADPEFKDYVVSGLIGGAGGATLGTVAVVGANTLLPSVTAIAAKSMAELVALLGLDLVAPGSGQVIFWGSVATVTVVTLAGIALGIGSTHWGVSVAVASPKYPESIMLAWKKGTPPKKIG